MALASSPLDFARSLDAATAMGRNMQSMLFAPSPCNNKPSHRFFPTKSTTTTATSSPILTPSPCFVQKSSRKPRSRHVLPASSLFSLAKSAADEEPTLHHKPSYFDLSKKEDDLDMDSDSSSSMSSIFSDAEEDDDKPMLRAINSNASLLSLSSTSTVDSYFANPPAEVPQKTRRIKMKSISNASALFNKPELSCISSNDVVRKGAPAKQPRAWGMPSFASLAQMPTTPAFPRLSKVRRTQSMFENPQDVLKPELVSSSSPASDVDQSVLTKPDCSIKTSTVAQDPFRRIDPGTLCEILDGKHSHLYDRHVVVDCRFEYEYQGGHIDGAININSKERLEEVLMASASPNERILLVFHCEYSAHRGPRMAMHLRNLDRQVNTNRYPLLHYPDIVILTGGYSKFFESCKDRCFPRRYVEMNDQGFADRCEKEMERFRRSMKPTGRTSSFTCGESASHSPIATRSHSVFNSFRFPPAPESSDDDMAATPTQPRRRLGGAKLAQCKLFS